MENKPILENKSINTQIVRVKARTSFSEAMKKVLERLNSKDENFTIQRLMLETKLHRKTVNKVTDVILIMQSYLENAKLEVDEFNRMKVLRFNKKLGVLTLPEYYQKLVLKTKYFPEPTEEQRLIVHLFLRSAISSEKSISLKKTLTLKKLVKQGQVIQKDGRVYLSDEGIIVAKGSLDLYPELGKIIRSLSEGELSNPYPEE